MSFAKWIEEVMHDECKAKHPKLYAAISELVAAGQTAKQIERELVRRGVASAAPLTRDMVRYTATVLVAARAAAKRKSAA